MKTIAILAFLIAGITAAAAQDRQVHLEASYDGFDPSLLAEIKLSGVARNGTEGPGFDPSLLAEVKSLDTPTRRVVVPHVTTKTGQRCTVELIKQTVPPGEGEAVSAGITLDLTPTLQNGKLILRGKSVVRHQLERGSDPAFSVINFVTRETFFNGPVEDGKPFTIHVDDGTTGKATITLTATLLPAAK